MDAAVVVGVGNIYACEALHAAGIHPRRAAGRISAARYAALAAAIRRVLGEAIAVGGTTLRDYIGVTATPAISSCRWPPTAAKASPVRGAAALFVAK